MARAGLPPDPWQRRVLNSNAQRILLLCTRQAGKSTTTAALAVATALLEAPALVLLLSPTQRQSGELFRDKVMRIFNALDRPCGVTQESQLSMALENGSRIVSLPGDEGSIRGYSGVALLVIDECARVPDDLYYACRPMIATSGGRMVCLSTPFGRRGFFHAEWETKESSWDKYKVTAHECPRLAPAFLVEERASLGDRWFRQEYECSFEDTVDAVFAYEDVMAAASDEVKPLFAGPDSPLEVKPLFDLAGLG